jgi:hypothetical protein
MIKNWYVNIEWDDDFIEEYEELENKKFDLPCEFNIEVDNEDVNENNIAEMKDFLIGEVERYCDGYCSFWLSDFYEFSNADEKDKSNAFEIKWTGLQPNFNFTF